MLLVIALSFVKLYDPYENSFCALMIKIYVHTTIFPLAMLLHRKLALYHPSILPNKAPCIVP
jgi:hypothetical protein